MSGGSCDRAWYKYRVISCKLLIALQTLSSSEEWCCSDPEQGSSLVSPGPGLFLNSPSDGSKYFPGHQRGLEEEE